MSKQEPVDEQKRSSMMTRDEWMAWAEAQKIASSRGDELRPIPAQEFVSAVEPRQWVGLTKEEFDLLVPYCFNEFDLNDYKEFARAIEAKLKEKNGG